MIICVDNNHIKKNMIKVLRKNQIVIFAIALMLVTAGYLNYTMGQVETAETSAMYNGIDYAGIGDARLVSNNNTVVESGGNTSGAVTNNEVNNKIDNSENANTIKQNNVSNDMSNNVSKNSVDGNKVTETSTNVNEDSKAYFQESRLERDNMYSEMLESYQSVLSNSGISSEQKIDAQKKISGINSQRNGIMIAENLIKNKGFSDVVIFANNGSISVVVMSESLAEAEIAQIQSIIERELGVKVENIHISNK